MIQVARTDLGTYGSIILYGPKNTLHPGEDCLGKVELLLNSRPFLMRGLWVKLTGTNSMFEGGEDNRDESPSVLSSFDLMQAEEEYQHGGLTDVLAGFGELECPEGEELLELNELTYSWPFSFKIPMNAPYSYTDENFETIYTLSCCLDSPAISKTEGCLSYNVIVGCIGSDRTPSYEVPESILNTTVLSNYCNYGTSSYHVFRMFMFDFQYAYNLFAKTQVSNRTHRNKSDISMTIQSDRPAVFPFERMKYALPVKVTLDLSRIKGKMFKIRNLNLVAKILMQTRLRVSEHVPFSDTDDRYKAKSATKLANKKSINITNVLWECSHRIDMPTSGSIDEIFHIPIRFDPKQRDMCLSNWPRPNPIVHRQSDAQRSANIYTFTCSAPLAEVRYFVEIEAKYHRQVRSGIPGFRRLDNVDASLADVKAEIFIHPPIIGSSSGWAPTALMQLSSNSSNRSGPVTPHANIAPVRVVGELLSKGPAALLVDRGAAAPSQEFVTPQRFAQLHQVIAQGIEIVPGAPIYTPAIAYLLPDNGDSDRNMAGTLSPLSPEPHRVAAHHSTDEVKEDMSDAEILRLVSPTSPSALIESNHRIQDFIIALPSPSPNETFLSRLRRCRDSHAIPSNIITSDDVLTILISCPLICDREEILSILLQHKCIIVGDDVQLLRSGGCVDQCFPLALERERIKTQLRMIIYQE